MANGLTRGQLARQGQVNFETVRFYEREGLLPDPSSGYRKYPESARKRLHLIGSAKALGCSPTKIRELLELRVNPKQISTDAGAPVKTKKEKEKKKVVKRSEQQTTELQCNV